MRENHKKEADREAAQAGAKEVINELEIAY